MNEADDYRRRSRQNWASASAGWKANADDVRRTTMPVSAWMIDAAAPQPGHVVLELAAGPGDVGFLAAELIQPGGELITSDFSPEMLTAAQERAREQGIGNVRFKQIDAESIDLETASVDIVLCRFGYMLMADPGAALRETRRVLRPGGRVAFAAWSAPEDNPWSSALSDALVRHGCVDMVGPDDPGPFRFGRPGVIEDLLGDAGFVEDLRVETVDLRFRFDSFDAWWDYQLAMSSRARAGLDGVIGEELARIVDDARQAAGPYTSDDGAIDFPARSWVAAATA